MADILAKMHFSDHNDISGWSESHMVSQATTLADAVPRLEALCRKRVLLLGSGCTLDYAVVSDKNIFRDSQLAQVPLILDAGLPSQRNGYAGGYNNSPTDYSFTSLMLRAQSGDLYRRAISLSGVPDILDNTPQRGVPDASFQIVLADYMNLLTQAFGMWVFDRDQATNPAKNITNVVIAGGVATVTCAGHGFNTGDIVAIRGVKGIPTTSQGIAINKRFQIIRVDANTFTPTNPIPAFTYISGGLARLVKYKTVAYDKIIERGIRKRNRGRPFGLPSGKRKRAKAT